MFSALTTAVFEEKQYFQELCLLCVQEMTFQSISRIISFSTIVATGVSEGRSCHDETLGKPLGGGRQGGGGERFLSNHIKSYC